jgi:hypothetical protein
MTKVEFSTLRQAYAENDITLQALFQDACENAYTIRCDSSVAPVAQCRVRAKHLAFPITAMLLDFAKMLAIAT